MTSSERSDLSSVNGWTASGELGQSQIYDFRSPLVFCMGWKPMSQTLSCLIQNMATRIEETTSRRVSARSSRISPPAFAGQGWLPACPEWDIGSKCSSFGIRHDGQRTATKSARVATPPHPKTRRPGFEPEGCHVLQTSIRRLRSSRLLVYLFTALASKSGEQAHRLHSGIAFQRADKNR
jgi:hypothetical protein